jgi:hypothetical protein
MCASEVMVTVMVLGLREVPQVLLLRLAAAGPLLREAGSRLNQSVSVDNGPSGPVVTTSKGLRPLARQNASSLEVRQPSVSAALL